MIHQLTDVQGQLSDLRERGFVRGYTVGWDWDVFPYTVKLGSTTYIGAAPTAGKTELIKEIQINLSAIHGLNHMIFTPETGSPAEVFAELCHAYTGKAYIKGQSSMSEGEKIAAEMFVSEHFVIVDPDDSDLTITQFYELVDQFEREHNKTIHTTLIDPWNELAEEYEIADLGREDKYLSRILSKVRKNAKAKNRHNFVVTHVRDQPQVVVGETRYYPMPHARELSGGQVWFRKGMSMIMLWRPPFGLSDERNRAYEVNELQVKIAKTKPKGTSKNGVYVMLFDIEQCRYYFRSQTNGAKLYANRERLITKSKAIQPAIGFDEPDNFLEEMQKPVPRVEIKDDFCPF